MNCNTHGDTAAVAFCRTCGKPLCNQCTRDVRGVIYCESCLAARMEGTPPAAGFVPVQVPQTPPQTGYQQFMDQGLGVKVPPGPTSGPNPAVAGMLRSYSARTGCGLLRANTPRDLAHSEFLCCDRWLSSDLPWQADMIIGIFLGFFWVYQILDAVRTREGDSSRASRLRIHSAWRKPSARERERSHQSSGRGRDPDRPGRAVPDQHSV